MLQLNWYKLQGEEYIGKATEFQSELNDISRFLGISYTYEQLYVVYRPLTNIAIINPSYKANLKSDLGEEPAAILGEPDQWPTDSHYMTKF